MKLITWFFPAILLLVGCGSSDPVSRTPSIEVVSVTNKLVVKLENNRLTDKNSQKIQQFIRSRGDVRYLKIKLAALSKSGAKQLTQVLELLKQSGIYTSQVKVATETQASDKKGDILLLVESYRAEVTRCRAGKLEPTIMNSYKSSASFGCATSSSLAQMVANPKDLIVGQSLGYAEGEKVVSGIDQYFTPSDNSTQSSDSTISNQVSGGTR